MKYKKIAKEIVTMRNNDLKVRQQLLNSGELSKRYNKKMEEVHLENANRLNEIIGEIGYPNDEKVGRDGSEATWLIIQHAISQPSFMKRCLKLAEIEAINRKINPSNVAFLTDRIAMFENKPQHYGTQFEFDENGKPVPYKLDAPWNIVNERRNQIGLNSLEERLTELTGQAVIKTKEEILKERNEFEQWKKKIGWIE